eukprot:COSAG04_NODE_3128_length_3138_cov_1.575189_3_plen_351_part_00
MQPMVDTSSKRLVVIVSVCFAAFVLIVVAVCLCMWHQRQQEDKRRRQEEPGGTADEKRRALDADTVPLYSDIVNSTFVSHHKAGAAATADVLSKRFDVEWPRTDGVDVEMQPEPTPPNPSATTGALRTVQSVQRRGRRNFIDTEDLAIISLRQLIKEVRNTQVLVLLLSREVMTRPWCLVEIHTALTYGIPIVLIQLEDGLGGNSWEGHEPPVWPDYEQLHRICGKDDSVRDWLDTIPNLPTHHDELRQRLKEPKCHKYDSNLPEMVKESMQRYIVERVQEAMESEAKPKPIFPPSPQVTGAETLVPSASIINVDTEPVLQTELLWADKGRRCGEGGAAGPGGRERRREG